MQANQPRPKPPPAPKSVIETTRPQVTALAPDWSVRPNDLRVMRENLTRAQARGAVPYDDAERLHTVINAFEDNADDQKTINDAVGGLASAVEDIEGAFDADTLDVTIDALNDLEPETRERLEAELEKSVRAMRTAAALAVAEHFAAVKRASEALGEITAAWGLE